MVNLDDTSIGSWLIWGGGVHSLKLWKTLTCSPLKIHGWSRWTFPFGIFALFSGALFLLVSGRIGWHDIFFSHKFAATNQCWFAVFVPTWRIIPISKEIGSPPFTNHLAHLEEYNPSYGDLRSPWLLTTYKSWDDPPSMGQLRKLPKPRSLVAASMSGIQSWMFFLFKTEPQRKWQTFLFAINVDYSYDAWVFCGFIW